MSMRITAAAALLVRVTSFGVLSLARGEDTITVFRNTLDRASSGARGGATLVRASGAATAPVRLSDNFTKLPTEIILLFAMLCDFVAYLQRNLTSFTYCFRFNLEVLSGLENEFMGTLLNIGDW